MQFWNWFFLATAVLATAKPPKQYVDISTLPECMQQCMRQETKHFDIEVAPNKRVCKETSSKIVPFWKWLTDVGPCVRRECEETPDETSDAFDVWYYDLCGHHFSKDSKDYDDDD